MESDCLQQVSWLRMRDELELNKTEGNEDCEDRFEWLAVWEEKVFNNGQTLAEIKTLIFLATGHLICLFGFIHFPCFCFFHLKTSVPHTPVFLS